MFLPSSLTAGLSTQQQQQADRLQVTYYSKPALFQVPASSHAHAVFHLQGELMTFYAVSSQDATLNNQTVVSPVLGCSAANVSISNLSKNVRFTVRHLQPKPVRVNESEISSSA